MYISPICDGEAEKGLAICRWIGLVHFVGGLL
jgi:hypothetical protein